MSLPQIEKLGSALGFLEPAQEIISRVYSVYKDIDQHIQEVTSQTNLPCKRGCDACCHESVFLSAPEFLVVSEHIMNSFEFSERESLVHQMWALADEYEDELELLEEIISGPERDEVAARIKFSCPLLSADGACRIYVARELNGRSFGHAWDSARNEAYGCELTHDHLRVLNNPRDALIDARQARQSLVEQVPNTEKVQVYPWWFKTYGKLLLE